MAITDSLVSSGNVYIQELPGFLPGLDCAMLRLDLLHPQVSGNKWYKLKHNISAAQQQGKTMLLSFGGAYSNHLLALAAAAAHYGMSSRGIVRGLYAERALTPVLQQCREYGMQLEFLERQAYDQKTDPGYTAQLSSRYPDAFIIPEGGANAAGRAGAGEIAELVPSVFTHIAVSVGTGTTFIGLRNALPSGQQLLGFVPMKGGRYLEPEIRACLLPGKQVHWSLTDDWHFGGFGKTDPELLSYLHSFEQQYGFRLDKVYTAKMMYGLQRIAGSGGFPSGSRILAIHTGGLGGN